MTPLSGGAANGVEAGAATVAQRGENTRHEAKSVAHDTGHALSTVF